MCTFTGVKLCDKGAHLYRCKTVIKVHTFAGVTGPHGRTGGTGFTGATGATGKDFFYFNNDIAKRRVARQAEGCPGELVRQLSTISKLISEAI